MLDRIRLHQTNCPPRPARRQKGRIENTAPAFALGLSRGYGLECDLQPAEDGTPMVFHDETVDRLMEGKGRLSKMSVKALQALNYKGQDEQMITFAEFLELAAGRGPLLVEVKSDWKTPKVGFLDAIAKHAKRYKGPLALMSFDPKVMSALATLAPKVPRGIVAGRYEGDGWWLDTIGAERGARLTDLLESGRRVAVVLRLSRQVAADARDALCARGAGPAGVHLDGALGRRSQGRGQVGRCRHLRRLRGLSVASADPCRHSSGNQSPGNQSPGNQSPGTFTPISR